MTEEFGDSDEEESATDGGVESMEDQLARAAEISDTEADPLAKYAKDYEGSGIDFFGLFIDQSLSKQGLKEVTEDKYRRAFRFWKEHMEREGRHPAFPTDNHVVSFVQYERNERGNDPSTVKNRLLKLEKAYDYWMEESRLPHPKDYQPIQLAKKKVNLNEPKEKDTLTIPVKELKEVVSSMRELRAKVLVVLQLKLGLRATEVANIQIQDLSIQNSELQAEFPDMGTHRRVEEHEDTIYIPSKDERDGNKSERPALLPLDDEVRYMLLQYLLIRPSVDEPWVFLTKGSYKQLWRNEVNDAWDVFLPEYEETEDYRKITSHYGRHRFSTYWRMEQGLQRELLQYMRGDEIGGSELGSRAAVDSYIHANYSDIEDLYRENIFKLDV